MPGSAAGLTMRPSPVPMRILLAEDDRMIGESLAQALHHSGSTVDWVQRGDDAEHAVRADGYAALLLDLKLPGKSGLDVLRTLRREGNAVPVMIVTARDTVADRVAGLDSGADDYLVKPFDVSELLARLRAVVRRKSGQAGPLLGTGDVELDPATHAVRYRGEPVQLSAREFALLHALLERPGAVLSREQLEAKVYGWNEEVESNAIEVLIHYVRKKLAPELIRNVRGVGWTIPRAASVC
jgi:two-component system, OmpR family, response regulator QseB